MTLSALSATNMANVGQTLALRPSQSASAASSVSALNSDCMDLRFGADKSAKPKAEPVKHASWLSIGGKVVGGLGLALVGDILTLTVVGAPVGIPLALVGTGLAIWGGYQAYRRLAG